MVCKESLQLGENVASQRKSPNAQVNVLSVFADPEHAPKVQEGAALFHNSPLVGTTMHKVQITKTMPQPTDRAEAVKEQLEISVVRGQALKFTEEEARKNCGESLVVASFGAQVKNGEKETRDLTVRLLFDGTHGVPVNAGIRVRDQDRSPAAPDIKRVLRQLANHNGPKFGSKVDVKDAQRLIPIKPCGWHLQACRCEIGNEVYINKTGTFGVASAAFWWSRRCGMHE